MLSLSYFLSTRPLILFPGKMISDFVTIFKYYERFLFSPTNFATIWKNKYNGKGIPKCSKIFRLRYLFTRSLPMINILCVLNLIYNTIMEGRSSGKISVFDLVSLLLWLFAFPPTCSSDFILTCQGKITRNLMRTMELIEKSWKTLRDHFADCRDDLKKVERNKSFKCWRFMLHTT